MLNEFYKQFTFKKIRMPAKLNDRLIAFGNVHNI